MILALLLVVTNAQYRDCVQAAVCKPAAFEDLHSAANLKTGKSENAAAYRAVSGDNQPAVGVSWNDARAYCAWKGKHLPSRREVRGEKSAIWLADAAGNKRAVLGSGAEAPSARAHWLSFRCVA